MGLVEVVVRFVKVVIRLVRAVEIFKGAIRK